MSLSKEKRAVQKTTAKMDYVEQRVAQAASSQDATSRSANTPPPHPPPLSSHIFSNPLTIYKPAHNSALFTPLNALLLSVLLYAAYAFLLRPAAPPPQIPREEPAVVFRTFTPRTLLPYNGEKDMPVYLAVRGRVFDVTRGRNFYGPGGPYANFAGRDASRGLACGSFDEDMLTKDLDGPLDQLEGLGPSEMEALQGWEERFEEKYLVVGKLVAVGEEGKEEEKN